MRRFIASIPGKVISQLVVMALLMPMLTLALVSKAYAQVATPRDFIAVVEFANQKAPGTELGKRASDAVTAEFAKVGDPNTEVLAPETVNRAIGLLGVESPPNGLNNLLRVGQELRATKVVTGDIIDYTIRNVDGGKQALVSMRVVVYDVASGLPINGWAGKGESTIRPSNTEEATLLNDAVNQAASSGVREILARRLPAATVLNTQVNDAYINQGSRAGFKAGQSIIVKRGREQVATARIIEVEPDSSKIRIESARKGVAPGDKVEAIFDVPSISAGFSAAGEPKVERSRKSGMASGLLTTLLVLGLVAVLVGGGGGDNNPTSGSTAVSYDDPTLPDGESAVKLSWSVNLFSNGRNKVRWQVYRSDVADTPVAIVNGVTSSFVNRTTDAGAFDYLSNDQPTLPGNCYGSSSNGTGAYLPVVTGGIYRYSIELVQAVDDLDNPNTSATSGGTTTAGTTGTTATTTGTTGTTGTNGGVTTTGTTTTGTTTGTTSTTTGGGDGGFTSSGVDCFTLTDRVSLGGIVTALGRPTLTAPQDDVQITGNQAFTFVNPGTNAYGPALEAVLEFSTDRNFATKNRIYKAATKNSRIGVDSFPAVNVSGSNVPSYITSADRVYWRVGVRNTQDKKPTFVYSRVRSFRPPVGPPPPP